MEISLHAPYEGLGRFYDEVIGDAVLPAIIAAFVNAISRHEIRFDSVADVGCGTGRFLQYLARFGVPLFGVDRSSAMLRIAARRTLGRPVRLFRQDLRQLNLPRRVGLITCNYDTLNYLLSKRALKQALQAFRRNLSSGGYLSFDLLTGAGHGPMPPPSKQIIRLSGVHSVWKCAVDKLRGFTAVEIRSIFRGPEGRSDRITEVHVQRWYPYREICRLLRSSNFRPLSTYDMQTGEPAGRSSHWVHFMAQRM